MLRSVALELATSFRLAVEIVLETGKCTSKVYFSYAANYTIKGAFRGA